MKLYTAQGIMMYKAWQACSLLALRKSMRLVLQVCMFQSLLRHMACCSNIHHVWYLGKSIQTACKFALPCWARQYCTSPAKAWDLSSPLVGEMLYEGMMPW